MAQQVIEISGSPMLEGKDGFYGSYLQLLSQIVNCHLKPDSIENNKVIAISLIKIGIASLPDPKRGIDPDKETRRPIYDAIQKEIDLRIDEAEKYNGGKPLSKEEERDIVYEAYLQEGVGGISSWMDRTVGVVTKNSIIRSDAR